MPSCVPRGRRAGPTSPRTFAPGTSGCSLAEPRLGRRRSPQRWRAWRRPPREPPPAGARSPSSRPSRRPLSSSWPRPGSRPPWWRPASGEGSTRPTCSTRRSPSVPRWAWSTRAGSAGRWGRSPPRSLMSWRRDRRWSFRPTWRPRPSTWRRPRPAGATQGSSSHRRTAPWPLPGRRPSSGRTWPSPSRPVTPSWGRSTRGPRLRCSPRGRWTSRGGSRSRAVIRSPFSTAPTTPMAPPRWPGRWPGPAGR